MTQPLEPLVAISLHFLSENDENTFALSVNTTLRNIKKFRAMLDTECQLMYVTFITW